MEANDSGKTENQEKPISLSAKLKLYKENPRVKVKLESGESFDSILLKESSIFDEAFDFYEKEKVTLSELGFILKKIHPRYTPRRYGCKSLGAIYEKLDGYEVEQTEEAGTYMVVRMRIDKEKE
ncbi:OST-HTH/LOTUS domain-containing protein [Bacteroides sp. 224]|uniref:OST-HTH/LOTUS domain-containing protein n=1 Tax=Bacteroides sp. 224 TaxID=2302936 RepID=UPI001EF1CE30|nr:OST-HTH/LOTUS domain-containing protein [Bacteroides sp. 224]